MSASKASLESQLGFGICEASDTEEMFWLRQNDDYQSKLLLGNKLAAQYRFRDAVIAYREAEQVRSDDLGLFQNLGGALLTLRQFPEAKEAYTRFLSLGGKEQSVSYPLGVWHYLQRDYAGSAEHFLRCLPCGDEMKIAVIYWHCIACSRMQKSSDLLTLYDPNLDPGHHRAYKHVVSLFTDQTELSTAIDILNAEPGALDFCILAYGISNYLSAQGKTSEATELLQRMMEKQEVWPSVPYLAAWNDLQGRG